MTSCLISSIIMELLLDLRERPEMDGGLEKFLGVGGCSSISFPLLIDIEEGCFSDKAEGWFLWVMAGPCDGDGVA